MKKKHKPLKLLADKVIYKLDDISMITPELLKGIDFMRLKRCTIFFKKKIEKEWVFGGQKFPKKSISIIR